MWKCRFFETKVLLGAAVFLVAAAGLSASPAFCGETIVTHETERYFYSDGKMEKFEGQHENTYFLDLEKNTLTRTRVYDYQTKRITPDETAYQVQNDLHSHPLTAARYGLRPLVRAYARLGEDAAEFLVIDNEWAHSTVSTPEHLIISRAKRLK